MTEILKVRKFNLLLRIIFLFGIILINSCNTSNNVVSHRLIQKRKYTKGWHFNSSSRQQSSRGKIKEENYHVSNEASEQEVDANLIVKKVQRDTIQRVSFKNQNTKQLIIDSDSTQIISAFEVKKKKHVNSSSRNRINWIIGNSRYFPTQIAYMTVDEKGQLFAFIALMVSLLLIAGFLLHLIGPWTISNAGLVVMWILLLLSAAIAIVKNESEVYRDNLRPSFRVSNIFMHWFFKITFVLLIVIACFVVLVLIIAFIIYLMVLTGAIITIGALILDILGIVIGIIAIVLMVTSAILAFFYDEYTTLFAYMATVLFLGILFYGLFTIVPYYLLLMILCYAFLISGVVLAIIHITLSIIDLT